MLSNFLHEKASHLRYLITRYVPLTIYLSKTTMKKEASSTLGGVLWWLLDPLFYCLIYYFVFAVIFESKTENFIAFLITGLIIFRWFSMSIMQSSSAVLRSKALMRQIDVPKIIFPIQSTILQFWKFIVAFASIVLILALMGKVRFSVFYILPIELAAGFIMILGGGLFLSAILPFFPDLKNIVQIGLRGLRYVSAIFFTISQVPEQYRIWVEINPLSVLVNVLRDTILYGQLPSVMSIVYLTLIGLVFGTLGIYLHKRYNRVYPRYVT